jgi:phage-related protein
MTSPITDVMTARSRQLNEQYPWIWLYEVEVPTTPPTRYRLTNYDQTITFGQSSDGVPLEYTPFPCVQTDVEQNAEGDLPQIQLQISNESLFIKSVLEDYDGLVGQPVVIKLVHTLELSNPNSALRFDGEIQACRASVDRVTWVIGSRSLTQAVIPGQRYIRGHCRFRYGDERCGYDLNNTTLATAHPSCPKTLDACELRGDAEVAAGLERQHPARFGGWPGIPRQGRR